MRLVLGGEQVGGVSKARERKGQPCALPEGLCSSYPLTMSWVIE